MNKLFSGKVLTGSNNWVNAVSGSRYVSWLPSFSVEVTHTSLLPGQQLRLQTQTSQLDNMVGTACCLTFNSVCAFGVVQWLLPDMKNIVMQGLVFFWMAGCGIILTLGFAQTLRMSPLARWAFLPCIPFSVALKITLSHRLLPFSQIVIELSLIHI